MTSPVTLAGATGQLGSRIAAALHERGAPVRLLLRPGSAAGLPDHVPGERIEADYRDADALARAVAGSAIVVSAVSGLAPVIVDAQTALLDAAVRAGVPRFMPSDFAVDFTRIARDGSNRNLDLRRTFMQRLDAAPIRATSIMNGAFADMLTGQMPLILFPLRRIVYAGSADQKLDFTTIDDTARYAAHAALDPDAPRLLRIAGDQINARELAAIMTELTGRRHGLLRMGSIGTLSAMIAIARRVAPGTGQLYPAWQGMQYMRSMFSGEAAMTHLDNDRYPGLRWTSVRAVLDDHLRGGRPPIRFS